MLFYYRARDMEGGVVEESPGPDGGACGPTAVPAEPDPSIREDEAKERKSSLWRRLKPFPRDL